MKGIQQNALEAYFTQYISGVQAPLKFTLITGGYSNLTYLVEDKQGRKMVLRRPPTGAVLATAHDMPREHWIISALANSRVPVPKTLALCEDESINDAPFYVMDYVEGTVLSSPQVTDRAVPLEQREALGMHLIEILAELHKIDPSDVGLDDLGRRDAYLSRQLKRWKTQWEKSKTRELDAMEEAHTALEANMPEQIGSAIVHGDFRLGNCLASQEGRIKALLDWELCTLGDPLADLGYLMNDWEGPGQTAREHGGRGGSPTECGGFPERDVMLRRYEELTGTSTAQINYYRAFQYWRLAAIFEGVLARYKKGVMGKGGDLDAFQAQVDRLAAAAVDLT